MINHKVEPEVMFLLNDVSLMEGGHCTLGEVPESLYIGHGIN